MTILPRWAYQVNVGQTRDYQLGELFVFGRMHHPQKLAISDGKQSYTFAQLDEMATNLALWLSDNGVKPGICVPVLAEKCAIMYARDGGCLLESGGGLRSA